jgi:hypothetical protein
VKKNLILSLILFVLIDLSANGQAENWDTYMSKFGDKPGSVLVDMGLINNAPDKKYPFLVITGPRAQSCDKKGIPAKEEISSLEDILAATGNFLTGVTAEVLAGTFTYNCERLNYYYVKDTLNIRNAIMRLYNRTYPNYSYAINIKYDPAWTIYRTFLYPSEETRNWMENTKIITGMVEKGDSLRNKRQISFDLYFRTDSFRRAFAGFAHAKGYKTEKEIMAKSPSAPYEIIISKFDYVKTGIIDSLTSDLKKAVKQYNGFYNGWEAAGR